MKSDQENIWSTVTDIEEFHFYCCPECNFKDNSREIFVHHVLKEHPNAKQFLEINQFIDNNDDIHVGIYVKEEIDEDDGDFMNPTDLKIETYNDISDTTNQNVIKEEKIDSIAKNEYYEEEINTFESINDEIKEASTDSEISAKKKKREKCQINTANALSKQNTIIVDIAKQLSQVEKVGESEISNSDLLPKKPKLKKDKNIVSTRDEKDVKCQFCGKVLSSPVNLKNHINAIHEGKRRHQCDICGKSYKWQENLQHHMDYTHFLKTIQCPQCERSFASKQTLIRHTNVVHEGIPEEKNFICDKCSRSYNENGKLLRHIKTFHDKIFEFKCQICTKEYPKKDQLKYHMESVHEKLRMTCDICGKVTDRKSLKAHMKFVHEKKEKWKCDICFKIMYKGSHIKTHFRTIHKKEIKSTKEYLIE